MEEPFATLIVDRDAADETQPGARYPLLRVTFMEESYDATCIAVQALVDSLTMFAGDVVRVQFIHARPEYSVTWEGAMPSRYEAQDKAIDPAGSAWEWREFVRGVHRATR